MPKRSRVRSNAIVGSATRSPTSIEPRSALHPPNSNAIGVAGTCRPTLQPSRRQTWSTLIRALDALPAKQRAAVILHDEEGYPAAQVATLLGISPATVRVHLHRGRKRMRELLGSEED